MSDQKPLQETATTPSDSGDQLPFAEDEVKRDMSYSLKTTYTLPAVTVKYILEQLSAEFKETREDETADKSLAGVYSRLLARVLKKLKRTDSPGYMALAQYIQSQCAGVDAVGGDEQPSAVVAAETAETSLAAAQVFADEAASSVRTKFPDIMGMELDAAIRAVFPSIGDMVLQAVRLKMVQGPTPDEAGHLHWQENFFVDLVARFPSLQQDLITQRLSIESAARMLFSRGQLEASRAEVVRSERRVGRGPLPTLQSIDVEEVKLYVAKELSIAGKPQPADAGVEQEATVPTEPQEEDDDDIHSRPTVTRMDPVEPTADRSEQPAVETVPARDQLPTLRIDTRDVRARLETVPVIHVAAPAESEDIDPSNRETLPPPAAGSQNTDHPKPTLGSRLLGFFGGKSREEQEK